MAGFVPVPGARDLADNSGLAIEVDGTSILVCRSGGEWFAVENRCSHADQPLDCGRIRNGMIVCPAHGARFDLETGEVLGGPAPGPLRTFAVRQTAYGIETGLLPRA
jgi:3-phenylpropionate/trans-cinnamate dioxygenase ferredoxin subunit